MLRLFSRASAAAPAAATAIPDLTEPDRAALFALAAEARRLPSWTRSVRAAQGGTYLSALRGRGMEYDESRPYQPGDDVRHLDWRVMARRGEAHTKIFREERERPVFVCVDDRAPMHFGTRGCFKRVMAARAAALVAWRAYYAGDRIGGMVFGDSEHHELAPRRGRLAVTGLLGRLCTPPRLSPMPDEALAQSLATGFDRLRRIVRPGSLVFVFSDFRGLDEQATRELVRVRQHSDVVLGLVQDPVEQALPALKRDLAVGNEFGEVRVAAGDRAGREAYADAARQHEAALRALASRLSAPLMTFPTDGEPVAEFRRLLAPRR